MVQSACPSNLDIYLSMDPTASLYWPCRLYLYSYVKTFQLKACQSGLWARATNKRKSMNELLCDCVGRNIHTRKNGTAMNLKLFAQVK